MNILSFRCGKLAAAGAKNNHSGPANASICALRLLTQAPDWRLHGRKFLKSAISRYGAVANPCADAGKRIPGSRLPAPGSRLPARGTRQRVGIEEKSCSSTSICVINIPRVEANSDRSASQRPLWISAREHAEPASSAKMRVAIYRPNRSCVST